MEAKLKLRRVGNSIGVIIPTKVLERLKLAEGDSLYLTETEHGFHIASHDPNFLKVLKAAEKVMRRYQNTLRELAR